MPTVRIYGYLRQHVADASLTVPGHTVGAALDAVCADNPALAAKLYGPDGLNEHVRVILRGLDIELHNGLATPVGDPTRSASFRPFREGRLSSIVYRVKKYSIHDNYSILLLFPT